MAVKLTFPQRQRSMCAHHWKGDLRGEHLGSHSLGDTRARRHCERTLHTWLPCEVSHMCILSRAVHISERPESQM